MSAVAIRLLMLTLATIPRIGALRRHSTKSKSSKSNTAKWMKYEMGVNNSYNGCDSGSKVYQSSQCDEAAKERGLTVTYVDYSNKTEGIGCNINEDGTNIRFVRKAFNLEDFPEKQTSICCCNETPPPGPTPTTTQAPQVSTPAPFCTSNVGHCGRAYQSCCFGFGLRNHSCGCKLTDGEGKSVGDCGTCGESYEVCCNAYASKGHACECDVAE